MIKKLLANQVNRLIIVFLCGFLFFYLINNFFISGGNLVNFLNNVSISQNSGWKNNESFYAGSELNFIFIKSPQVAFEFSTKSKADQGVEIIVDGKSYSMLSPNLSTQKLAISIDKNKPHTVTVRHTCSYFYFPCQIKIEGIYLNKRARLSPFQLHDKTISVLGDSISTIYGKDNYSQVLANDLGYELHDASIIESTVSKVNGVDNAIDRYKKDLLERKSDITIIFMGTNDADHNVPLEAFKKDYKKIVSDVKKSNPDGKLILVGPLHRKDIEDDLLKNYGSAINDIAQEENTYFIDPINWLDDSDLSDEIHPSLESQKKIVEKFKEALVPILK